MKNFSINTKSQEQNFYSDGVKTNISDDMKKAIIKAGLRQYSESDLSLYMECLVEVLNEKKEAENGKDRTN